MRLILLALLATVAQGQVITHPGGGSGSGSSGGTTNQNLRTPGAYFSTSSATTVCVSIPYTGVIKGVKIYSDATVTATVDVRYVAYASYAGAASASSIKGSGAPATITTATYATPSITGWTTSPGAGMYCFVPSSITAGSATYFVVQLQIGAN